MKREYVTPMMIGERFSPNEYIAACGESGTTYKFVCDAQRKWGANLGGIVYLETNGVDGLQRSGSNPDSPLGLYHSCSATHIVESTSEFLDGYFEPTGVIDARVRKVVIWRGEDGQNIHCTTKLNKTDWETAKS
ncbi:hypothetical protein [Bariatricus sp. SGI.019]|uniref:hypothetical protein n=1 Tax=Bariatricus sp. SGI.019 TaxID=3420548 RepID=UPI003D03F87A